MAGIVYGGVIWDDVLVFLVHEDVIRPEFGLKIKPRLFEHKKVISSRPESVEQCCQKKERDNRGVGYSRQPPPCFLKQPPQANQARSAKNAI